MAAVIVASFYAARAHARHRYDFWACLRLLSASCRRHGARHVLITDPATAEQGPADFAGAVPFATALPDDLMPAILAGQAALLEHMAASPNGPIILAGADCLLLRDPAELFGHGLPAFDLAVTTHPFVDCILNTGMIGIHGHALGPAAALWRRALARCGHRWGDDQLALAAEIRPTLAHGTEDRDGLAVRFLPVPGWNEAPDDPGHRIRPLIAHFRGPRKAWMAEWAQRHADLAA